MRLLLFGALALLLGGCSADVTEAGVTDAATRFVSAAPAAACRLLAPETVRQLARENRDCAATLADLDLPAGPELLRVEVAVASAQARYPGQVLFLARFPQGWLVTAAGCRRSEPDPAVPYECEVEP